MVLQEHEWNVEDALQVLQMFSDSGADSASSLNLVIVLHHVYFFVLFICLYAVVYCIH